ncbi:MAG: hypothetical protein AAGI92_00030 [Pseudomonadota bacterium]
MSAPTDNHNNGLSRLWRRKPVLLIGFATAATLALFFGLNALRDLHDLHQREQQFRVQPWMTPSFLASNYNIPIEDVLGALEIDDSAKLRRTPIGMIARRNAKSRSEAIDALNKILETQREETR